MYGEIRKTTWKVSSTCGPSNNVRLNRYLKASWVYNEEDGHAIRQVVRYSDKGRERSSKDWAMARIRHQEDKYQRGDEYLTVSTYRWREMAQWIGDLSSESSPLEQPTSPLSSTLSAVGEWPEADDMSQFRGT
jgi:hypothetical protein